MMMMMMMTMAPNYHVLCYSRRTRNHRLMHRHLALFWPDANQTKHSLASRQDWSRYTLCGRPSATIWPRAQFGPWPSAAWWMEMDKNNNEERFARVKLRSRLDHCNSGSWAKNNNLFLFWKNINDCSLNMLSVWVVKPLVNEARQFSCWNGTSKFLAWTLNLGILF